MKFEELNISNEILDSIKRLGISVPTQIQEESIPLIMEGKDVIGESATGSGKTTLIKMLLGSEEIKYSGYSGRNGCC